MDREKIVTIVLGLVVGIVLAAAYFFGSKFLPNLNRQSKPTAATTKRTSAPAVKPENKIVNLTITSPEDNTSTADKIVKFTGSYIPGSTIILFAPADEKIATSDAQGKFNFDVALEGGENEITVNSLDSNGKLVSAKRNVTREATQ